MIGLVTLGEQSLRENVLILQQSLFNRPDLPNLLLLPLTISLSRKGPFTRSRALLPYSLPEKFANFIKHFFNQKAKLNKCHDE